MIGVRSPCRKRLHAHELSSVSRLSTTRARSDANDDDDDASAVDDEVTSVAAPTATAAARRIAMRQGVVTLRGAFYIFLYMQPLRRPRRTPTRRGGRRSRDG